MGANDLPGKLLSAVISAKGGEFETAAADRDKLCLLSDGTLYVAQSYQLDMAVLAYQDLLKRSSFKFTLQVVSVADIQKLYAGMPSAASSGRDDTYRQREVTALIREAVQLGASDIHFRNRERATEVLMRIDGFLEPVHSLKAEDGRALCGTMYGSMCDVADPTYEPRKSQDGRLRREFLEACGLHGARIATRAMEYGNLMVLRLLYNGSQAKTLAALGYDEALQVPLVRRMTKRTTGINIFSGPTGSGKSTSLEALLSDLLRTFSNKIHLLTIEHPPEYAIPGAVQTPLICDNDNPEAVQREWTRAISNAMRLDPDTIMVGEMRDRESATTAFRAAMTGHGVWTTLHANSAWQIPDRLIDIGVAPSFVTDASLVTGLINQSLAAVNCVRCRRPYARCKIDVEDDLRERIERFCDPSRVYLRGADKRCAHCGGKGIKGRTVVAEVCVPNQRLMNAYREAGASKAKAMWVREFGGVTKNMQLIAKINAGLIDPAVGEQKVCTLDEDDLTLA